MKKRILSLVMALVMLIGFAVPAQAAEGDAATTTNGAYTEGVWAEGGTGSATYDVDGTNVTLSKTATPVAGQDNVFDITLRVETSTTTTSRTNAGAVVLVIDVSGSMKYCADCGNENRHETDCPKNTNTNGNWGSEVKTGDTRISAAKAAAKSFLASYAGTNPAANRQLSIVTFASNYRVALDWVNVAGGEGQNSYNAALNSINGLSANGGTNLEGGLYTAREQLGDVSGYGSKSVILLTDGVPTYRINGGDGRNGSERNNNAAKNQATAIKNAGATLYSVCFGVKDETTYSGGPTVGNFLRDSVASSGCAYNADNTAELNSAFAAITESITSGLSGEGWTATDPMADMVSVTGGTSDSFSGSNGTYTWTLGDPQTTSSGNQTTYVYTYTYRITLDVQGKNFAEGQFFPTNEPTYLNIDGQQYAFPVPGVKGVLPRTSVTATKVWLDEENQDGIRPGSVTLQLKKDGAALGDPVTLNADSDWSYTWTDLIEMSGGVKHQYTVEEAKVDGYTASYSNDGLTVYNTHIPEQITISGTKTWNDAKNQDGKRPADITINLLADGVKIDSKTVTAEDDWKWSFTVDKYAANEVRREVKYTITEDAVVGYTTEVNNYDVTNTHAVEKTEVEVKKVWVDNNNQDGKRPGEVTVHLYADGADTGKTLKLNEANNWTGKFTDIDKYAAGKVGVEVKYTVKEDAVPEYTASYSEDTLTITNTHEIEKIDISGQKTWNDNDNQDGKRPASITINLMADGEKVDSRTVTAGDGWKWSFTGLDKYKGGKLINYTITEDTVEGYTAEVNDYNVTNTHTPGKTSVNVTKVWDDADNQDGKRPESVTINLLADGEKTNSLTLSNSNNWTGAFTDLDEYKKGEKINYTVEEETVKDYTTVITGSVTTGFTVKNTHAVEKTSISGEKTWDDAENQDGKRPTSITVKLLANSEPTGQFVVVTEKEGKWTYSFTDLDKYANGSEIIYTVSEEEVKDYTTTYNGNDITNSYTPGKISVQVSKVWEDAENQDGIRPNSVTVELLADEAATGKTVVLNDANNWRGTFTELDEYKAGKLIDYTVAEVEVHEDYESAITGSKANGFVITNSHTPYTVEVSGTKTWDDNNNQDGKRPASITINLMANNVKVDTQTVEADASGNWNWSFTNLPKNKEGKQISYTIEEVAVGEYTTLVNGYNVTNTHAPEKVNVSVKKVWLDAENQDGIRPADITIKLLADGKKTNEQLILSEGNSWTATFQDLDKYAGGKEIKYTIAENEVEGYTSQITGNQTSGYTVTNSHTPAVTDIEVTKTWEDKNNQDGMRPETITVNLLANGKTIQTQQITAETEWKWTFENLPVNEAGQKIVYTVTENAVENYTTQIEGFAITNTHAPGKVSVQVTKAWDDSDDQDGIRPESVTVTLFADGVATLNTLELTAEDNWTGSFQDLDEYSQGKKITYTVQEDAVEGYEAVITGSQAKGFVITNSHNPELVSVSGTKTWDDANNQDNKRPASITINLLKDGKVIETKTVTEADGWAWTFENLPKFENQGTEIAYAITETAVEGYSTTYDGYNVINSYTPEEISVTVTKAWADSNDAEGIRPDSVTIKLLANGKDTGLTLVLDAKGKWTGSFTGLAKFEDGKAIDYTVDEVRVKGYNTVVKGTMEEGFVVTNSHTYIPQTGDDRTPVLWISMMVVSAMMIALASINSKKRRNGTK